MSYRYILFFVAFLFCIVQVENANAQVFTPVDAGLNKCQDGAADWVDLDNDGDLDVFLSGIDESNIPQVHLYRNEGNGSFTPFFPSIAAVYDAACAFADIDNDGDADLALSGFDGSARTTEIYRNDGGFSFTSINAGMPGLSKGSMAWADYNADGYIDLLFCGQNDNEAPLTYLFENNQGTGFSDSEIGFAGIADGSLAWYDLDRDGDPDIAICGKDSTEMAVTYVYINDGDGFSKMNAGITGLWNGMIQWGDFNNDGYADLALSGTDDGLVSQTLVYRNDSGQSFSLLDYTFSGVSGSSVGWGDMNNDGLTDLVAAGSLLAGGNPPPPADDPFMHVYLNLGNENFQEEPVLLDIPADNNILLGDYDNDSDLDMLVAGLFVTAIGTQNSSLVFENEATNVNTTASAPGNLTYQVEGNDLVFNWDAATAGTTPQDGLTYNMRIGTQAGNMDMLPAHAELSNGYRRIVGHGNTAGNTTFTIGGLPFGNYFASVQAIDHTYAGSAFSSDLSIVYSPTATFNLDDSVCLTNLATATYTGNASPAAQYIWDFDGANVLGGSGTGQGPHVLQWSAGGLKTVSLTVIENGMTSIPETNDIMVVDPIMASTSISGEDDICQGTLSSTYSAIAVPGAASYEWYVVPAEAGDFTGNGLVTELNWNPSFHGLADVFVAAVNYCGPGPLSDTLTVTVRPLPEKPATPEGPVDLCKDPGTLMYSTSGAQFGLEYTWEIIPADAGALVGNGPEVALEWNPDFSGQALLFTIAENTCGEGPGSDSLLITVELPPDADAGEPQTIDYLTPTFLDGSASGGSGDYSFFWTPGSLLVDPEVEDPETVSLEFSTVFTLFVTDNQSGCVDSAQVLITVTGGPLSVATSAVPALVCPGEPSQLKAVASGGSGNFSFMWTSDPAGFTDTIYNPVAYPEVTTMYYVTVTEGANTLEDSVAVVVKPLPAQAGTIIGPGEVCAGDKSIRYEIDAVPDATSYSWLTEEGVFGSSDSTSILLNFTSNPSTSNTVLAVVPMNACGEGPSSEIIINYLEPPETPSMISGPDSLCTTTDTITEFALAVPVPGAASYEWKLIPEEAGTITGNTDTIQLHWEKNWEGDASLVVKAVNLCGTSDWSAPALVHTFSCVGIPEAMTSGITDLVVYPNPAQETLYVKFKIEDPAGELLFQTFDMYGREMDLMAAAEDPAMVRINISSYPSGLYFIRISNERQVLAIARFVVM